MANLSNINGKFVVDTAGNIGVGTLTPRSDANTTNISIQSSGTARLFVNNTGASGKEYAIYSSANGDFGIFDYGAVSARLVINSSGNATFAGSVNANSTSTFLGNGAAAIKFGNTSTLVTMSYSGTTGVIRAESGSALRFDTNGVNTALTLDTSQNATFAGDVDCSNVNASGVLTATAIDTDAYLTDGSSAGLYGRYLGQAIYGSGTGSGDNYGSVADVFRYKTIAVWRKNSSTNAWSNPSTGDTLVEGNYAHKWSGTNMEPAYSEYVFYFANTLGYSFVSQTILQHSTNGNSFDCYLERASSTTNPYDTTGWTTMVTKTGISSWPGLTAIQNNWEVGGGYPGLFRIRLVPTWNNSNSINLGSFQAYGSYGNFQHAWSTQFDRSVNFQSKIGVGTNPSRALDVTQTALIQGAGNVNAGTLALGPRASGVGKWSSISGAHYNQSSGSGNGTGSAGIMMIGTYGANGENDVYIGGGLYEVNAATNIRFYTHTTDTSTAGGTQRMLITSSGDVLVQATSTGGNGLSIRPNATAGTVQQIFNRASTTSDSYIFDFQNGGTTVGYIRYNNTTTTYATSSDYRLKEDLQDFAGLDMVSKIPVYDFKWKSDENRSYGVMAHELQKVLPDAVTGEKDAEEMQGVDYSKIVPLLVKSIQELKADNDSLKARIETLENK